MLISLPRRHTLTDRQIFDAQTSRFCQLSRENKEVQERWQFEFFGGTLSERAEILNQAEALTEAQRKPAAKAESNPDVIEMRRNHG